MEKLGVGIAVIGFSAMANLAVSAYLQRRARITDSPALEGDAAHLRTDASHVDRRARRAGSRRYIDLHV